MTLLTHVKIAAVRFFSVSILFLLSACATPQRSHDGPAPSLAQENNIGSQIVSMTIKKNSETITLTRAPATRWQIEKLNDKKPTFTRANENLVHHLLDLLESATRRSSLKFEIPSSPPAAALTKFITITLGDDELIFNPAEKNKPEAHVYSRKNKAIYQIPSAIVWFLDAKTVGDFRDNRFSDFDADDVEKLRTKGHCPKINLVRDGNRWRASPSSVGAKADEYLETFLSSKAQVLDSKPQKGTQVCVIDLEGRKGKKERLEFYKKGDRHVIFNPALSTSSSFEISSRTASGEPLHFLDFSDRFLR